MEAALGHAPRLTVVRPGAIYGAYRNTRERYFVERVRDGIHELKLPDRGQQIFHAVAVERVGRGIVAALEYAPGGFWACNVVDPTYLDVRCASGASRAAAQQGVAARRGPIPGGRPPLGNRTSNHRQRRSASQNPES